MHSTSHYYSSLSVIVCRYGYRAPFLLSCLHLAPRRPPPNLTAFFCRRFRFTGTHSLPRNSLFSRMERFWTGSDMNRNQEMLAYLQKSGSISSEKVAEVMETIDRALFVPAGSPPYIDSPMPIGHNATISAPHMHAMCLDLLENHLKPGMRALDVGSGIGYLTACVAIMVGPDGHAVGVEHIPKLVELSMKNIQKSAAAPLLKAGSLSIHAADGRQGWAELAPYDAIHVGAASCSRNTSGTHRTTEAGWQTVDPSGQYLPGSASCGQECRWQSKCLK